MRPEIGHSVLPSEADLWTQATTCIRLERGWSLRRLSRLGKPRPTRCTWLAEGEPGIVIVKARDNPHAAERAHWTANALAVLHARGYPVPSLLWHGRIHDRWLVSVMERLPGEPLNVLHTRSLDELLALADLQADADLASGGWDVSWWIAMVIFDGWEGWTKRAADVAPQTMSRLSRFLEPAFGHRLPATDFVHGDLNITNVLARDGRITGVVDWDDVGLGSRAFDLTSVLFDWQRLKLALESSVEPTGRAGLLRRILELVGDHGLRCTVAYGAIARLALTAQRGERTEFETWRHTCDALLDVLS